MKMNLIKRLAMGAFVGCFIVMLVMVLISLERGSQNIQFSGITIINAFLGSIPNSIPNGYWDGNSIYCCNLSSMVAN